MSPFAALQVNDYLESLIEAGGVVVDHHSSDFFPERFFDLVVVLQTDNTVLYDRLAKRGYSTKKIQENVQCEIMHVPIEEAQRSYKPEVVQVCRHVAACRVRPAALPVIKQLCEHCCVRSTRQRTESSAALWAQTSLCTVRVHRSMS